MAPSVLIFGATGVAGVYITQAVINAKNSFSRVGIFTSQNTVENKKDQVARLKGEGVHVHVGDITNENDVLGAYKEYDTIVSAVGRNAILTQIDLLRWAEQTSNITHFLPSEYGTDIEYFPHSAQERPHQLKLQVRAFIKQNISRLKITYVVTGPYPELWMSPCPPDKNLGGFDVANKRAVLVEPEQKVSFTAMTDLGVLVVKASTHPVKERVRALKVNSFTATPKEVLAEFEKQTGRKWEVKNVKLDELRKEEEAAWAASDPLATVFTLRRIWAEGGTIYEKRDNAEIDGENVEGLSEAVRKAIEKQTGAKM